MHYRFFVDSNVHEPADYPLYGGLCRRKVKKAMFGFGDTGDTMAILVILVIPFI
jgi:hypothetical protein